MGLGSEGGATGFVAFIKTILRAERCRLYAVSSALLFLVVYALGIGMIFRSPNPLPDGFQTPSYDVILKGPIGQVPWLVVYIDRYWIFSVNLEAATAAAILSTLFGLNVAILVYRSRYQACRRLDNKPLLSIVPSFFSVFSCCGSGLVMSFLFALGAGGLWSSIFLPYGRLLAGIAASVLALNIVVGYRRALRVGLCEEGSSLR